MERVMYINNYTPPIPPQQVLDKCHQVLITDPVVKMWEMKRWCRTQELSLIWSESVGTEDVSGSPYDEIAAFYFIDAQDATMFSLKFK
jgi:hypothetical protein